MTIPRHVTIVTDAAGLPYVMGTIPAAQFLGTYDPKAVPTTVRDAVPAIGGLGNPVTSGTVPPLYRWGFWFGIAEPDTNATAKNGTLAQLTALADQKIVTLYYGPDTGGVSPTLDADCGGWIPKAVA